MIRYQWGLHISFASYYCIQKFVFQSVLYKLHYFSVATNDCLLQQPIHFLSQQFCRSLLLLTIYGLLQSLCLILTILSYQWLFGPGLHFRRLRLKLPSRISIFLDPWLRFLQLQFFVFALLITWFLFNRPVYRVFRGKFKNSMRNFLHLLFKGPLIPFTNFFNDFIIHIKYSTSNFQKIVLVIERRTQFASLNYSNPNL